jgi:TPR repeat protein
MLLTALKVKLAAMVAVAGLDTAEMPGTSAELNKVLEALASDQAAAQKAAQDKTTGPDVNKSFNDALVKVNELAKAGDKDAQYALAHWGVLSNSDVNAAVDLYRKAAAQGQVLAKVELAQVLLQAAPQDQEKAKEAVQLIQEAEAADNKVARRLLANLYVSGAPNVGIEQSVEKAKTLLEKGSVAGDGESTLGLSQLYAAGVPGLAVDAQKSLDYLIKATEQKNAVAMSTYAARLFDGDTGEKALVKKDPAAAMKMFEMQPRLALQLPTVSSVQSTKMVSVAMPRASRKPSITTPKRLTPMMVKPSSAWATSSKQASKKVKATKLKSSFNKTPKALLTSTASLLKTAKLQPSTMSVSIMKLALSWTKTQSRPLPSC